MTIIGGWPHGPTASAGVPYTRHRHHRDARHAPSVAPPPAAGAMDVRPAAGAARCSPRDPPTGRAYGGGESDVGGTRIQGALKNVGHRVDRRRSDCSMTMSVLRDQRVGCDAENYA